MNDPKTSSVLQKLYTNSTRKGQVSLVSTHDVTNPPVHYCNWSLVYFKDNFLWLNLRLSYNESFSQHLFPCIMMLLNSRLSFNL